MASSLADMSSRTSDALLAMKWIRPDGKSIKVGEISRHAKMAAERACVRTPLPEEE
jgi:hypothetical protein